MTPIQHVATRVVSLVSAHSDLVTEELHAGIDLARLLVSGEELSASGNLLILNTCGTLETRYQRLQELASIFA